MIKIAVVGYGNIGKYSVNAINSAEDMELVGIIRRSGKKEKEIAEIDVVNDVLKLKEKPDVVLLCTPTREVENEAKKYHKLGINTVDSFDIHGDIWNVRCSLDKSAKDTNTVAIISAGWDPGSDSVVRTLMEAIAPKGVTHTNFGPGMSMGHTVAVKAIEGVKKALSMTIPTGSGIHRRMVYVEIEEGYDFKDIETKILSDDYFAHDETHVNLVDNVDNLLDMGHGTNIARKGVSGETHNQNLEFNMSINNPAATAQIMVSCARATLKQPAGAYTLPEIPPMNLLYGDLEKNIKRLV